MKTIRITSMEDPRVEVFHQNSERKLKKALEPKPGYFITESPLVIGRALRAGYEPIKLLRQVGEISKDEQEVFDLVEAYEKSRVNGRPASAKDVAEVKVTAGSAGEEETVFEEIPVYEAEEEQFRTLTGFLLMRGLLCLMQRKEMPDLAELLGKGSIPTAGKNATSAELHDYPHRIVVLDDVENPTNIGAIIRSAAALSMDMVLTTKGSSDPLYRRASRVSMGCIFQIPWAEYDKDYLYAELKKAGYKTVAMALKEKSVPIDDEKLNREDKLAIIMGNEGYGLPDETIDKCDYTAIIPMTEGVDSLNVAAASAVAFWQLRYK